MYILDTNICIYIIKKKPPGVFKKFEQLPIGSVSMSLITYGELEYGALRSNNSEKALNVLEELANYIPILLAGVDVAKEYASIRADLASKGTLIGNNDLWIAAHARSLGYTLVSNNIKEFERVEHLQLENWV
ncbi:type II toxin-antitoxin system VapC family toxin [Thiomicrorhabdus sp. Milos-T2]|uniref:type II toxin-antitoxin system tRNA(fMet)-specific endonuclease VapC n=1 Tax=Thiomicrorhabdus sp. Milos-T2 TaxID=90814 RepID=UPI000494D17D|nr:type II toxin-antitoxin system VapC family toxin [Thiomicrorhabdus sp. Milos-T2]